jgi:hypothetical protein
VRIHIAVSVLFTLQYFDVSAIFASLHNLWLLKKTHRCVAAHCGSVFNLQVKYRYFAALIVSYMKLPQ